ncbi:MAG: hypothetical protein LBI27_04350 [Clostridiales bacterium]|nr:hypothetical protein [Clostridiales bacterium]
MAVTIVLVALIVGFMALTVFSLTAMLFVRRREKERDDSKDILKTIEELDAALDAALNEINKLGALIKEDVDEKYKSTLFLYNLVEDKHKEIVEIVNGEVISEMLAQYIETHGAKLGVVTEASEAGAVSLEKDVGAVPAVKKVPTFTNPRHKQIWEMKDEGQSLAEIAKELDMGQGEVKLILYLIDRAS